MHRDMHARNRLCRTTQSPHLEIVIAPGLDALYGPVREHDPREHRVDEEEDGEPDSGPAGGRTGRRGHVSAAIPSVRDTKPAVEETHATELLQLQLLQKAVAARPVQAPTTPPRQESPAPAMSEEAPPRSGMLSRAPIATMLP